MNILLIMPTFYNYYTKICEEIENRGDSVFFFPDEIKYSFLDRAAKKMNIDSTYQKFNNYIMSVISKLEGVNIDRVIIVFGGRCFEPRHIDVLRNEFKTATFIYYTWDSIASFPGIKKIYRKFDLYYSFDKNDCKEYGFRFHPLFYSEDCQEQVTVYDFASIMTFGKEKADNYRKIINALPEGLNGFQYLVMKHRSTYLYNVLKYPSRFEFANKYISFKPMSNSDVIKVFKKSKVVIDCPIEGQNGLTMRTFEVLNAKRKLITTNANIKTYDFYCPENIYVVEDDNDKIPMSFFSTPFDEEHRINESYSLKTFVTDIIYN